MINEAYPNLDEMYEDCGLCNEHTVIYHLAGELESSEIRVRPILIGSAYASDDQIEFVEIGGTMLVDRSAFHGSDSVVVEAVR